MFWFEVEALAEIVGSHNIAKAHLGIGISIAEQQTEFPKEVHPALGDSAASEALTLANISDMDGVFMMRSSVSWLPAELPNFEPLDDDVIQIKGLNNEEADALQDAIREASANLNLA